MLTPALPGAEPEAVSCALAELLDGMDAGALTAHLVAHGLNGAWHSALDPAGGAVRAPADLMTPLRAAGLRDAVLCEAQRAALLEIDEIFSQKSVAYIAFKGADARERFYARPALRSANDIDLLVDPRQWSTAVAALAHVGFSLERAPAAAHEATLRRGPITIDLHRDLLRPGRTRGEVSRAVLARRQRRHGYWGPSDSDTIWIMLVHPAFVRYVTNLSLASVVDFDAAARAPGVDWEGLTRQLHSAGVATAGWTVATWYRALLGSRFPPPVEFLASLRPGTLRTSYLHGWLVRDLPARLFDWPLAVPLAFTLALHDTPSDAVRAIGAIARARAAGLGRWRPDAIPEAA
jgi:hypothetical protein